MSKSMITKSTWQVGGLLLAVLPALLMVDPAWAKVGIASVVNGEPLAKPPAENERVLHIGNDMVANEVVTTKANDRAHLVFLDGSTLTVGPNSEITIDRFVYDPEKRAGQLSLDAGRGVFRYVGGAISKNSEVTVKSRGATMGIRGGITSFSVGQNGQFTANFLFGRSLTISGNGVTQTTNQPGTQITVPPGGAPNPPTPIPPGVMQQVNNSFQGPPGTPGDSGISGAFGNSNFGNNNSGLPPGQARGAIPQTQQAQLGVHGNGNGAGGNGSQQASNEGQGNGPQQGGGPLQGGSPLQGAGPMQGGGPQEGTGPVEGTGPMEASGPLQSSGPLQNAGPLAAATPLQQTGPVGMPGNLAFGEPPPGPGMPNVPFQEANFIPAALGGNPQALQQLQNLLGSPQGTDPNTLSNFVNTANNTPPNNPPPNNGPGPTFFPPTGTPSPPTVFNTTTSNNVSPN